MLLSSVIGRVRVTMFILSLLYIAPSSRLVSKYNYAVTPKCVCRKQCLPFALLTVVTGNSAEGPVRSSRTLNKLRHLRRGLLANISTQGMWPLSRSSAKMAFRCFTYARRLLGTLLHLNGDIMSLIPMILLTQCAR